MLAIARGLIMKPRLLMIDEMSQRARTDDRAGASSASSGRSPNKACPS